MCAIVTIVQRVRGMIRGVTDTDADSTTSNSDTSSPVVSRSCGMVTSCTSTVPLLWMIDTRNVRAHSAAVGVSAGGAGDGTLITDRAPRGGDHKPPDPAAAAGLTPLLVPLLQRNKHADTLWRKPGALSNTTSRHIDERLVRVFCLSMMHFSGQWLSAPKVRCTAFTHSLLLALATLGRSVV